MTSRVTPALFAMVSAIDQRKQELEQTFRQQQLLQRRLLDAIPDPIRLEDHQGVLIDCNQAFSRLHGPDGRGRPGSTSAPRLPVRTDPGTGVNIAVDAQGKGRIWKSPGSKSPDDEG